MNKNKRKRKVSEESEKDETMDVYDEEQLEEMLENDEITEAEYSFMLGREKVGKKRKGLALKRREHQDTVADELAKNEYEDD